MTGTEAVAWLRAEIGNDHAFAASCLARPFPGSDMEAIAERVADGEAKLAILALHIPANPAEDYDHPDWLECAECGPNSPGGNFMAAPGEGDAWWPCQTIHLLASGYRHRPGYAEHWGGAT